MLSNSKCSIKVYLTSQDKSQNIALAKILGKVRGSEVRFLLQVLCLVTVRAQNLELFFSEVVLPLKFEFFPCAPRDSEKANEVFPLIIMFC